MKISITRDVPDGDKSWFISDIPLPLFVGEQKINTDNIKNIYQDLVAKKLPECRNAEVKE